MGGSSDSFFTLSIRTYWQLIIAIPASCQVLCHRNLPELIVHAILGESDSGKAVAGRSSGRGSGRFLPPLGSDLKIRVSMPLPPKVIHVAETVTVIRGTLQRPAHPYLVRTIVVREQARRGQKLWHALWVFGDDTTAAYHLVSATGNASTMSSVIASCCTMSSSTPRTRATTSTASIPSTPAFCKTICPYTPGVGAQNPLAIR